MYARLAVLALLLAAVVAGPPPRTLDSTSDENKAQKILVTPPYVTIITKGDTNVPLGPSKEFKIASIQCTGDLDIKGQVDLCPPPYKVVRVEITLYDYVPGDSGYIYDDLSRASLIRTSPCLNDAPVYLRVGCVPQASSDS